jgi:hypothetical protein
MTIVRNFQQVYNGIEKAKRMKFQRYKDLPAKTPCGRSFLSLPAPRLQVPHPLTPLVAFLMPYKCQYMTPKVGSIPVGLWTAQ